MTYWPKSIVPQRLAAGLAIAFAIGATALPAAAQNLVTNGTFQITGGSQSFRFGNTLSWGTVSNGESLSGWTISSPTGWNWGLVFTPGSANAVYDNNGHTVTLYNQSNSGNGFNMKSPAGGNFVAIDAGQGYGGETLSQTVSGLVTGKSYQLSFAWAAAQESDGTGTTTQGFQVSLGNSTQATPTASIGQAGFSGWFNQTFTFVATGASELLSFVTDNNNSAVPPLTLLANVSLTQLASGSGSQSNPVPEPASLLVFSMGIAGLAAVRRRKVRRTS
jgi:hypothetical protein